MKCPQPFARHCLTLPGALSTACSGVIFAGLIGAVGLQPLQAQPPQTNRKATNSSITDDSTPSDGSDGSDVITSATEQIGRTARSVGTRAISTITGEGTAGNIAKFTGPNQIGNSVIIESAGNIGIGTASPGSKLTVSGSGASVIQGDNSSTAANAYGIHGRITSTAPGANASGVRGTNNGANANGYGVYGTHAGSGSGVYGYSAGGNGVSGRSVNGRGVYGLHSATSGTEPGVLGETNSNATGATGVRGVVTPFEAGNDSAGVRGINQSTLSGGTGVYGSHAGNGSGVYGIANSGVGVSGNSVNSFGVFGDSNSGTGVAGRSVDGIGIRGTHSATTGISPGVLGETNSTAIGAIGVQGVVASTTPGFGAAGVRGAIINTVSSNGHGVYGSHAGSGSGVYGTSNLGAGVAGFAPNGYGVYGDSSNGYAVYGTSTTGTGVYAISSDGIGIIGSSGTSTAIHGESNNGTGVRGVHFDPTGTEPGMSGESYSTSSGAIGVQGVITSTTPGAGSSGVRGINNGTNANGYGVYATHAGGGFGVFGKSISGVGIYGESDSSIGTHGLSNTNTGVFGLSNTGVGVHGLSEDAAAVLAEGVNGVGLHAKSTGGLAGLFEGNVTITGTLAKGAGTFKIDHPLDPANKYLSHSFVESPDMMNIYNGNVTLDKKGQATVKMPDYFTALNREFRYQLTCIGGFAPVYVAQEIKSNQFKVAGGKPGMKVSWMVTGVRKDAYANANRVVAVEEKKGRERGAYLHPELFGQPKTKAIGYAQSPNAAKAKLNRVAQQTTAQTVKK